MEQKILILLPRQTKGVPNENSAFSSPAAEVIEYPHERFFLDAERLEKATVGEVAEGVTWTDPDGLQRSLSPREIISACMEWSSFSETLRRRVSEGDAVLADLRFLPEGILSRIKEIMNGKHQKHEKSAR